MASNNIILVDLFADIVDSMRKTGTVTSSSEVSGRYTILSANNFSDRQVLSVDDVDYVVYDPTATGFDMEAANPVTGLDFAGKTWKSLAPYYMHGHPVEITNRLNNKNGGGIYSYQKYPLIVLLQDFQEDINADEYNYASISPDILIVNSTKEAIHADERYDYNYRYTLYPLYSDLIEKIKDSGYFTLIRSKDITHTKTDRPYWGTESGGNNTANRLSDPLDAIELNFSELLVKDTRKQCKK